MEKKASAFAKKSPIQGWLDKNSYDGGYDAKLYRHKSKTKPKVTTKPVAKKTSTKPKKDLIGSALADRSRRYNPYKNINKAVN